jgi:sec-independent protein translocase protein TatA
MFNIGPSELILILIVALVVVGPKRLPEIGKAIGNGLKEFRKATSDIKNQLDVTKTEPPAEEKKI